MFEAVLSPSLAFFVSSAIERFAEARPPEMMISLLLSPNLLNSLRKFDLSVPNHVSSEPQSVEMINSSELATVETVAPTLSAKFEMILVMLACTLANSE